MRTRAAKREHDNTEQRYPDEHVRLVGLSAVFLLLLLGFALSTLGLCRALIGGCNLFFKLLV